MIGFQRRRGFKRLLYSRVAVLLLAVILILFLSSVRAMYEKNRSAREARQEIEARLRQLEARRLALQDQINKLETPRGLEEEVRTRFPVALEGERVVVIIDPPVASSTQSSEKSGFWSWIKDVFTRD